MRIFTPLDILAILIISVSAMLVMYVSPQQTVTEKKVDCPLTASCPDFVKEVVDHHGWPFTYKEKNASIVCHERKECTVNTFNPILFFADFFVVIMISTLLASVVKIFPTKNKKRPRGSKKK